MTISKRAQAFVDAVIAAYNSNLSYEGVARKLGSSTTRVQTIMRKYAPESRRAPKDQSKERPPPTPARQGPTPGAPTLGHPRRVRDWGRPGHLDPVTLRGNILRGEGLAAINARKTHCKRGHPFDEENTYVFSDGRRQCKACVRSQHRATSGGAASA